LSSIAGNYFPKMPNNGKNTMNIEILAIRWRFIGGNNVKIFPICEDWDKNNRKFFFQFAKIGIKIIKNILCKYAALFS
jgi:hypothetical protein